MVETYNNTKRELQIGTNDPNVLQDKLASDAGKEAYDQLLHYFTLIQESKDKLGKLWSGR